MTANVAGVNRLDLTFSNTNTQAAGWRLHGLVLVSTASNPVVAAPGGTLTANGTTTDVYSLSGLTVGRTYTVSVTGGATITTADADSRFDGVQIVAAGVTAMINVVRPTFGQTVTFTAADVVGSGQGSATQAYTMPATRRFDFNDVASPTAAGFTGVSRLNILGTNDAFGFVDGFVTTQDRGTATAGTVDLYRDNLFVDSTAPFRVRVTAGQMYDARVYVGDQHTNSQVTIFVEGVAVATSAFTTPGNFSSQLLNGLSDTSGDGFLEFTFRTPTPLPSQLSYGFVSGLDLAETGMLPAAAPLLAATLGSGGAAIDLATVQSVAAIAIDRLSQSGISAADIAHLQSVQFFVSDLDGLQLGLAGTSVIFVDVTAAGHGWYVDDDASTDEPFEGMDLMTVLMHELGHTLGYSDLDPNLHAGELMSGTLSAGEHRDVDSVFSNDDLMYHLESSSDGGR